MWIKELNLTHYRNYQQASAAFSPGLNVFIGDNAQGKTNFLEAIYFLSVTRSHRTKSDKDLIYFDERDCSISGTLERLSGRVQLEILLSDKGRITKINTLKQAKLSDYIGAMMVVLFAPEDLQLVKGSPSLRRKFMDIDLGQIKPVYLSDLSHYNHVLKQRNAYLKSVHQLDSDFLSVLDEQLVTYGSRVMAHRLAFVQSLAKEASKHHQAISNGLEKLSISYQASVSFEHQQEIYQQFMDQLKATHQRDFLRKNTGVGPHRDDLVFYINDMNANFASQGQHRSLILSLKMAEVSLMKQLTGDNPILLLDDVMSELDNTRQTKLLGAVKKENVQTFITTTSLEHLSQLPKDISLFKVNKGIIERDSIMID
ncbi:TPA: DNA replication/repair protein RecF [Streptococcus equi subsp. zooepidemicus]|nr:DNA replication/repair protein RecF [Streptococcus equi subsp. zooepidemicus]